jgi:hypothetical protein
MGVSDISAKLVSMTINWMLVLLILEDFEDTKGVIRIHKLNTERKHFSQKKKDKRTKNDLQNIHKEIIKD